jgi:tetratricopeptide (TPR) repeat protein
MKKGLLKLLFIVLGFLLGCAASMIVLWYGVMARVGELSKVYGFEKTPIAAADVADPEIYKILEQADKAIQAGNPQQAIDLILPKIDGLSSPIDKATGYQLLAVAEFNLGSPQQAVPYAKKMVEYDHGPFALLLLAQAYDNSGDQKNALATYQQILVLNQPDSRVDYNYVRSRASALSQSLGTPIP